MTIGFVIDSNIDFPGGVQRFVKGLYKYITSVGHQAVIFTAGQKGKAEGLGFNVFRLGREKRLPGSGADISVFADWVDGVELRALLVREKVDILHLQGIFGILGVRFLDVSDLPSLTTFHNFLETEKIPSLARILFPLIRYYVNKTDVRVVDSETAYDLISMIAPGEYRIIPPGIEVAMFRQAEMRRVFPKELVQILYVGRLDERKGLLYLLRVLSSIQRQWPQVALAVVGKGPLHQEATDLVSREGIKNVKFLGFVPDKDLPLYYRGSDIFCSPATHGECFGIVLLEALAAGLPVVAFNNPGYRNILVGKGERFLAKNRDTASLASKLLELIRCGELRQKMAVWGSKEVEKYDWDVVGKKYVEIYEKLKTQNSTRPRPSRDEVGKL